MTTVLVVDDEPPIREVICFALHTAEYLTLEAGNADEARGHIIAGHPDLILLDLMLPGRSGLELAQELKRNPKTRELPIIMLTAKAEEHDKVKGLDAGADDYVTKPFSPLELLARVKAVLRRSLPSTPDAPIEVAGLYLEPVSHRVTANGVALELAPTEYRLLHFFMSHPERAYNRPQLLNAAWGRDKYVDERTVDVHIRRLRKLLEPSGHHELIQTVRGLGYRFSERV
jgi:two-component system phosphate regulon response regulator PhoB